MVNIASVGGRTLSFLTVGLHSPSPVAGAGVLVSNMLKDAQLVQGPRFPASVSAMSCTYLAYVASKIVVLMLLLSISFRSQFTSLGMVLESDNMSQEAEKASGSQIMMKRGMMDRKRN